jgi:hypothetical protein
MPMCVSVQGYFIQGQKMFKTGYSDSSNFQIKRAEALREKNTVPTIMDN